MQVPVWLTFAIALVVMIFGAYRLYLATRPRPVEDDDTSPRKRTGLYNMSPKTHLVVGVMYLLLGGVLIATSLGFNPFSKAARPAPAPAKDDYTYRVIDLNNLPPPPAADAKPD